MRHVSNLNRRGIAWCTSLLAACLVVGACATTEEGLSLSDGTVIGATDEPDAITSRTWEPFKATYRIVESENGVTTIETWRVEWRRDGEWTMTALEGSTTPDDGPTAEDGMFQEHALPGTVIASDTGGITLSIPGLDDELISNTPAAPNEWLQPRYAGPDWSHLAPRPGPAEAGDDQVALLGRRVEHVPCQQGTCRSESEVALDDRGVPVTWMSAVGTTSTRVTRLAVERDDGPGS